MFWEDGLTKYSGLKNGAALIAAKIASWRPK